MLRSISVSPPHWYAWVGYCSAPWAAAVSLIVNNAGIDLTSLYPAMTGAMILCIGQTVLAKFAETYFRYELTAGTPFTQDGAKELLRLGTLTICIPLGCLIVAEIVSGIMAGFLNCDDLLKIENGGSVTMGVMFIIMSVLCRYGAELEMGKNTARIEE